MNLKVIIVFLVLLGAGVIYWFLRAPQAVIGNAAIATSSTTTSIKAPTTRLLSASNSAGLTTNPADVSAETATSAQGAPEVTPGKPAAVAPLPPELAALEPMTVLENMRIRIRQYGEKFGGNPVGTNPEITRALQGNNPKQINFLKADGNRVNERGELVDVWGTPYFFHQLSATLMEIHSAGPDRIMFTPDDLVIK
jgi:hypothetical protein